MRVESSKMYHEDPRGGDGAEHTTPSRLLRVVGVAGHLSRSGRQAQRSQHPLSLHPTFLVAETDRVGRVRRMSASRSCDLLDLWMGEVKTER